MVATYLTFFISGTKYGLPISDVIEIRRWEKLQTLPGSDNSTLGLLSIRGELVPVIDTGFRLGWGPTRIGKETGIIVVRTSKGSLGLQVDKSHAVVSIPVDRSTPSITPGGNAVLQIPHVMGITSSKFDRGNPDLTPIVLLNLDTLIGSAPKTTTRLQAGKTGG